MEIYPMKVFLTVAAEKSFSRAAEKLFRTQPAVSLAIQRLENELEEKLFDRSGRELRLTEGGRVVLDYARRFQNLEGGLQNALSELRDHKAGRLLIGANESTALYLLRHIQRYQSHHPKVKVDVRRALSRRIPSQVLDGEFELGAIRYDPEDERLNTRVIFRDYLALVVCPSHRFSKRRVISIKDLAGETIIGHSVVSPYREVVQKECRRYKVPLNIAVEMPTVDTVRRMVQLKAGVAFLPRMCIDLELEQKSLSEVHVRELKAHREIRLVWAAQHTLSHAARAFLKVLSIESDAA